ncbi:MAG: DUF423 domain-containing protein [Leptospiraceae bacterium]|nr:DUF423 domain-containing protein [Leptospiraceae bacterium]
MRNSSGIFFILAALCGGLAVAFGAFGAHALKEILQGRSLEIYQLAARYCMYHGLALFGTALWLDRAPEAARSLLRWAGWLLFAGVLIFCGSLFILSLTGIQKLGMITPIGGVAFIAGWIALFMAGLRSRQQPG